MNLLKVGEANNLEVVNFFKILSIGFEI